MCVQESVCVRERVCVRASERVKCEILFDKFEGRLSSHHNSIISITIRQEIIITITIHQIKIDFYNHTSIIFLRLVVSDGLYYIFFIWESLTYIDRVPRLSRCSTAKGSSSQAIRKNINL